MSRIRFATIRALAESFPEALQSIGAEPTDEPPVAFLTRLAAEGKPDQAIAAFPYLLPRREAVWWGCASTRTLLGDRLQGDSAALRAAEAWVREPTEENRRAALDVGSNAASNDPLTWLALAAGWSSGTFASTPFPVPAHMTPRAVRVCLHIAGRRVTGELGPKLMQSCLADGVRLAEAEP